MHSNNNKPALAWKRYIYTCTLLFFSSIAFADNLGFNFINDKSKTTIPFRLIGDLIVIPVKINDNIHVNLVLDTGGRSLILFGKSFRKLLEPVPGKTVPLLGYGKGSKRTALLSLNNSVTVSPDVKGEGIGIVLAKNKYFFPNVDATMIHGIIGYQIFTRFIVEIDYPKRQITLAEPYIYGVEPDFQSLDLLVKDTKPYIQAHVETKEHAQPGFFHIDTGSARELILFENGSDNLLKKQKLYKCSIGKGLNGNILGYKGKHLKLQLGNEEFSDIDTYILKREFSDRELQEAFGSIGSGFLKDFVIIFDYAHQKFYYKRVIDSSV